MSIKDNWLRQGHIKTSMWSVLYGTLDAMRPTFLLLYFSFLFSYLFIERLYRIEWHRFSIDLILTLLFLYFICIFPIYSVFCFFSLLRSDFRFILPLNQFMCSRVLLKIIEPCEAFIVFNRQQNGKHYSYYYLLWQPFSIWRVRWVLNGREWSQWLIVLMYYWHLTRRSQRQQFGKSIIGCFFVPSIDCLFGVEGRSDDNNCLRRLRWTRMVVVFVILIKHRTHMKNESNRRSEAQHIKNQLNDFDGSGVREAARQRKTEIKKKKYLFIFTWMCNCARFLCVFNSHWFRYNAICDNTYETNDHMKWIRRFPLD